MKSYSDKTFPPAPVGASVRVPIPQVDKGRGDIRNILAIVVSMTSVSYTHLDVYKRQVMTIERRNGLNLTFDNERERETDRQTDRQTDRYRQSDGWTDERTER